MFLSSINIKLKHVMQRREECMRQFLPNYVVIMLFLREIVFELCPMGVLC